MSHIHVLPIDVATRIAAGEVVERPASVVKELVENAIDAKATDIVVQVEAAGMQLISVADNGLGMDEADLRICIEPHATSKIRFAEDLDHIQTMGFRGEALPSVASISQLEILSRSPESDHGYRLMVEGGGTPLVEPCAAAVGTEVRVRHLFFNTPARQKFLKSERTELGHIQEMVRRLALAHPSIRFTLRHQEKDVLRTQTLGDLRGRIAEIWDVAVAEQCLPFEETSGDVTISGFAGRPSLAKAGSPQAIITVNGRAVRDRLILHAIGEAYRTLVMRGEYPFCVLSIQMNPTLVDVNVHPTKAEVRFVAPQAIHQLVVHTLRAVLQNSQSAVMTEQSPLPAGEGQGKGAFKWTSPSPQPRIGAMPHRGFSPSPEGEGAWPFPAQVPPLFSEAESPSLRPLGQLARTYLLYEAPEGDLVLVDQHAAHERLGYIQLKARLEKGGIPVQRLLIPAVVELEIKACDAIVEAIPTLDRCGLEIAPFGGDSVVVKSMPVLLADHDPRALVQAVAAELAEQGSAHELTAQLDHVLMTMACHRQVRAGDALSFEEIAHLAHEVATTPTAERCPHGRPTWIRVPKSEIEKWFKRTL